MLIILLVILIAAVIVYGVVSKKSKNGSKNISTNSIVSFSSLASFILKHYNIELGELKHPKEFRQSFDFQSPQTSKVSRAFVFGKQNSFFVLRGGYGEKRYFSEKAKRRGLAVGVSYEAGPSIGFLKPYYLELVRFANGDLNQFIIRSESYSEDNRDTFLDITSIYGSSGFSKGLSEISLIPGGHAKAAVHFDWGAFDEFVKAIEAGIMVDFYFQTVPIMVESPEVSNVENSAIFFNLYINLQLGKRW